MKWFHRVVSVFHEPELIASATMSFQNEDGDTLSECFVCLFVRGKHRYASLTDETFKQHRYYKQWVLNWIDSGDVYFLKEMHYVSNDYMVRELKRLKRIIEVVDV
jgi:hypothetical protein